MKRLIGIKVAAATPIMISVHGPIVSAADRRVQAGGGVVLSATDRRVGTGGGVVTAAAYRVGVPESGVTCPTANG